jgi:hypothetical protein
MRHVRLSVLTAVHENGGMTAAALDVVRPLADEIVVAFDSRMPRDQLGPLERVADVLVGFEFLGSNRYRPWLREQAHGDWLLVLDSDELVSEVRTLVTPVRQVFLRRETAKRTYAVHRQQN